MSAMELTKLAEKVKTATKICTGADCFCSGCPYRDEVQCGTKLQIDSSTVIEGLQKQLNASTKKVCENADKALAAQFERDTWLLWTKELEKDIQKLRNENKDLDERNDKLVAEINHLNDKLIQYDAEMEYQLDRNKALDRELTRYKDQEQMLAKQPVAHFDEPMRIEPISTFGVDLKTARKVAKAANKAAIACERFNKALDELSIAATKF